MSPHSFWQDFDAVASPAPWRDRYPALMPDGRVLTLPIRPLSDGETGIASLILNQASFRVEAALADALARRLRPVGSDLVIGAPTLGLSLARAVAERLGHTRYVALGNSRKFWYDDALSVPVASITSPDAAKRLYLDPRMLPLLAGARIALIDDVFSSGRSIAAALDLLDLAGAIPVALGAAMLQTDRWRDALAGRPPGAEAALGVIETPLLRLTPSGWVPAG